MRFSALLLLIAITNTFIFPECCFSNEGYNNDDNRNFNEIQASVDLFLDFYGVSDTSPTPTKASDGLFNDLELFQYLDYTFAAPFHSISKTVYLFEWEYCQPIFSSYVVITGLEKRPPKA